MSGPQAVLPPKEVSVPLAPGSRALQGALARIGTLSQPCTGYSDNSWDDSEGGGFEDSVHIDCPAG